MQRRAAEVATTWVTASELFYGAAKSAKPDANGGLVVRFVNTLPALAPDLESSRLFGEVKARLATAGRGCGPVHRGDRAESRGHAVGFGARHRRFRTCSACVADSVDCRVSGAEVRMGSHARKAVAFDAGTPSTGQQTAAGSGASLASTAAGWFGFGASPASETTCTDARQPREVAGPGGYEYRQYPDGAIDIIGGPAGVGRRYRYGHKINDAITKEIGVYPERDPCSQGEESAATEERGWTEIPLALATGEIEWIQERVDQLTAAAKGGDDFSESDKEFLKDLYWWIGAGGYAKGLGEASQLQRRYVSPQAKNEPVEIDAEVYQSSTIVQYAMKEMKRIIAEDIAGTGAIRDDGEIWSTDVLSPTRQGDQATLGEIIKGGYLLAEQDNKRLKYANNRFALKSFSETQEGFFPWEADRSVKTRWRVDDVWDFASFEEQKEKKREDITHIPLPNGAVLKLPDGLSEYMVDQGVAQEFEYYAEWVEEWPLPSVQGPAAGSPRPS